MRVSAKVISVVIIAFLSLKSSYSRADVDTNYSIVISKSFLASELLRSAKVLEINKELPPSIWQMALPIQVQSGQVYLKSNLTDLNFNNGENLSTTFSGLSFAIHLSQFAIDTVVAQSVGGVNINIRVQTTCKNLTLSYDASDGNIGATFGFASANGILSLTTSALNLNLNPKLWHLSTFQCNNIQGIEQTIASQLQNSFLSNAANLQKLVTNYINSEGGNYLTQILTTGLQQMSDLSSDYHVALSQNIISLNPSGELITTRIHAKLISGSNGSFTLTDDPSQNVTTLAVFLPKGFMELLLQESILQQLASSKTSSKNISGMQSLMDSRFLQFFFWPALLQLPSDAELSLQPYLQNSSVSLKDVNGETIGITVTGSFGVWVSYNAPMVYFSSPLNLSGTVTSSGLGAIKIKSLNIKTQWDKKYIEQNNPPKWIATSFFSSDLKSFIKLQLQTFAWPTVKIGGSINLNFTNAKLVGNTLGIFYQ